MLASVVRKVSGFASNETSLQSKDLHLSLKYAHSLHKTLHNLNFLLNSGARFWSPGTWVRISNTEDQDAVLRDLVLKRPLYGL